MNNDKFIHDTSSQLFFDAFNYFIFASDEKVFNKLLSKSEFVRQTKTIPGAVVELGVFKGSGMAAWLKTLRWFDQRRMVYGFDIFDVEALLRSINSSDRDLMKSLFIDREFDPNNYDRSLKEMLSESGFENFKIVKGNIFDTIPKFLSDNPGFRASILNFDMDTAEPTMFALEHLWPRLVSGGIAIFDEYGINEWTESDAVDTFLVTNGLNLLSTNLETPTAYIVKP